MPAIAALAPRQSYNCDNGYYSDSYGNCYYDPWYSWGRWVLLAVIIVGAFLLFCLFSCITARRRRRMGMQPIRGTGWAGNAMPGRYYQPNNAYGQNAYPQQEQQGWQAPPPQYGARDGGVANPHLGAYKPQTEGYGYAPQQGSNQQAGSIELQSPGHAYAPGHVQGQGVGGESVYAPPAGPPPRKDEIVR